MFWILLTKQKMKVDITLETYPYPVGSSFHKLFPSYFHEGGPKKMLEKLMTQKKEKSLFQK